MKIQQFILIGLLFFLIYIDPVQAQILQPVKWSSSSSKKEVKIGEELELIFTAQIQKEWYLYSSDFEEGGPMVSTFTFEKNKNYELIGGIIPIEPLKKYDDVFEMDVKFFKKKGEFRQKVKILKKDFKITVSFRGQTCSEIDGKCIPLSQNFTFDPSKITVTAAATEPIKPNEDQSVQKNDQTPQEEKNTKNEVDSSQKDQKTEENESSTEIKSPNSTENTTSSQKTDDQPLTDDEEPEEAGDQGLWLFAVEAMLWGFFALLTPCVFPMIPMTVTFFTKQSKTRAEGITKAVFYGISIIAIYTILGVVVSRIFGSGFNNWLSTHWIPNLFFFLLLVTFGLSFLGMFDIVLPSSWVNRADKQADKGGYYGIVFMAFTLALVSFSCTAPIVGTVLIKSAQGEIIRPIVGMVAFSSALALPFTLFAIFPSWMNSLPRSGGWLNAVKVVLGFLELALSLKFLSVADQVYHWGILDRDVFLAFWIVIFGMIGFYLLGKIRMPHDSSLDKVSVPRAVLAIFSLAFVVYMIPGMFGAPLKPLAGYLPPQTTLDFPTQGLYASQVNNQQDIGKIKYADFLKLPHNLTGFFDYKQALEYAKEVNKPIFIDFTGHGCVNCREMEARVWSDPEVLKRLREDYVVVALYVDDKKTLPKQEWYTSPYDQQTKKTIGDQNFDFQISKFNSNGQPFYCLIDTEGNLLVKPKEYDLKVKNFVAFLDRGLNRFKKKQILAKN